MGHRNDMLRAERQAQLEQYRQIKEYYAANRRPWIEWPTFLFAFAASILVSLRRFGIGYIGLSDEAQWVFILYWASFLLFIGLDSIFVRAHYPVHLLLGGFNPSRIFEKFSMQGRLWQLSLILILPPAARIAAYAIELNNVH